MTGEDAFFLCLCGSELPMASIIGLCLCTRSSQLITAHIYRPEQLNPLVAADWSRGFTLHALFICTGARQKDTEELRDSRINHDTLK